MKPTKETVKSVCDSLINYYDYWFLESEGHLCNHTTGTSIFFSYNIFFNTIWGVTLVRDRIYMTLDMVDSFKMFKAIRICLSKNLFDEEKI